MHQPLPHPVQRQTTQHQHQQHTLQCVSSPPPAQPPGGDNPLPAGDTLIAGDSPVTSQSTAPHPVPPQSTAPQPGGFQPVAVEQAAGLIYEEFVERYMVVNQPVLIRV
eukprot:jgi/Chrzof1/1104/Cz01g40080.t1